MNFWGYLNQVSGLINAKSNPRFVTVNTTIDSTNAFLSFSLKLGFNVSKSFTQPRSCFLADVPFPRVNDTPAMLKFIRIMKVVSYAVVFGLPTVIAALVFTYLFGSFS